MKRLYGLEILQNNSLQSKQDFQELMLAILNPLKPHYSENKARLQLGSTMAHYDIDATWMEAFSRPLWALVPYWAGGGREEASAGNILCEERQESVGAQGSTKARRNAEMHEYSGNQEDFATIYRRGLCAGTDPESPEYWGKCSPFNQRFVEMAAISYGIMFAPEVVWEPLSEQEKKNLCGYLNKINEHPLPVCNWILFAVLVNIAMKKVGYPYSQKMLDEYLDGLETFYLGDGWYQDGDSGQKDYYISFAIHFYCLVYAKVMEQEDAKRAALYKERALSFAKQFIYWFDEDGDAIPFGRSLTYRFSQVSFFSACLLADLEPFPVEVMKGLIVRHLRSWLKKDIFDRDNILTIGYGYPNLTMAERYNAPGSPYWSMKTFAFLMLPDEHPFWTVEEAPLPEMKPECPMPYADMFVRHYGNHTTAFAPGVYSPNGHGQIVAKYGKFAYDTKFSISVAKSCYELHENAPDNMLAFFIDGYVYVRRICMESKITESGVYSKWSPYPGITVETTITPDAEGHTRVHKITSDLECVAYDCGFSIDRGDFEPVGFESAVGDGWAEAKNVHGWCKVTAVDNIAADALNARKNSEGQSTAERPDISDRVGAVGQAGNDVPGITEMQPPQGHMIISDPNLNLLYTKTAIPSVKYRICKGMQEIMTCVSAKYMQ